MAMYTGVILTESLSLNLQQKVFKDTLKLTISNDNAELEQKVFNAEKINLYLLGDNNEIPSKKTRVLTGHMTWGEGSNPPRKHPLETSWTRMR